MTEYEGIFGGTKVLVTGYTSISILRGTSGVRAGYERGTSGVRAGYERGTSGVRVVC